jgi:hypothetical protein
MRFNDIGIEFFNIQVPFKFVGQTLSQATVSAQWVVLSLDPSEDRQAYLGLCFPGTPVGFARSLEVAQFVALLPQGWGGATPERPFSILCISAC